MSDLSDYDFMELVAFARKVESEGYSYARENYPPKFEDASLPPARRALLAEYHDRIEAFWDQDDAVDLHNAHIDESDRRAAERRSKSQRSA